MLELSMEFVNVNSIMLDPLNPRFVGENEGKSQAEIINMMLNKQATKELMNSMRLGLQWVNRIVVRKICELSEEYLQKIPDRDGFEYVVVEGNTRMACLKSETLRSIYDTGNGITIPVLVAEKGEIEREEFENEIQIIQARANVMIVKQWEDIPKFKHIYNMYLSEKRVHPLYTPAAIVDQIKNTTGGTKTEVRTAILRCMIVNKIAEDSDCLEDKYWPFVEAFESNSKTRKTIGLNDNLEFVFDSETEEYQKELLNMIPEIIEDAFNHLPNGKQFRDKYKEIVKACDGDVELILDEIRDIMNPEVENKTWVRTQNEPSTEQKWNDNLDNILITLQEYPVMTNWARNHIDIITSIKNTANRLLTALENN